MSPDLLNQDLDNAVQALANDQCDHPSIVTDYVLVYAARRFDDDGDTETTLGWAYPTAGQPIHHSLGLLDQVAAMLRHATVSHDDA